MATLFDPIKVDDLDLANRIVLAPLTRNRSPKAVPRDLAVTYYVQRATAGLLITEATAITHQGQGYADVPGLYAPEQLAGWRKVTDAVHAVGGKIVVQLWHVGRISHNSLQPGGGKPVAPSAITAKSKTYLIDPEGSGVFAETSEPRALERDELPGIVEDFRRAAKSAIEDAGFDGVEVHGANGYLLDQFLRSGSNHRTDEYGGSIENRARLALEVVDAVVAEVGPGRTGIRLSPVTPGNDASDPDPQPLFEHVVRKLATRELAYIHVFPEEPGWYEASWFRGDTSGFAVHDIAGLKVGVLLCTELMFNEHARGYGRAGADLIVVPRATSTSQEKWVVAGAMGAIVSGCYVVSSNRSGASAKSPQFGGRGLAFAPDGTLLADTSSDGTLAVVDLDAAVSQRQKSEYPCNVVEQA